MSVYALELRKRINSNSNCTIDMVGLFSSPKKAKQWVVKYGKERAKERKIKNGFYACVLHLIDFEDSHLVSWWGFSGERTPLFTRMKPKRRMKITLNAS